MLNHSPIHIVYINAADKVMRRERMEQFLNELGLPWRRIEAITPDGYDQVLNDKGIDMNFKDHTGRNQTLGEIGCSMSHRLAWLWVQSTAKITLILEDDAIPSESTDEVLKTLLYVASILKDSDYEFCYLGRQALESWKETGIEVFPDLIEPRYSWLAHAYMITPFMAHYLLTAVDGRESFSVPVDEWIPFKLGCGYDDYLKRRWKPIEFPLKALAHVNDNFFYQSDWNTRESDTEASDQLWSKDINPNVFPVKLVTVATDPEHPGFVDLLNTCVRHGWDTDSALNLGHGVTWGGGTMEGPGGGQKVNLLKQEFEKGTFDDNDLIVFVDGYDTALCAPPYELVRRWLDNFPTDRVVFAAEKTCWPDPNLDEQFPESYTPYQFLNSGMFIGRAKYVKQLFDGRIEDHSDDQFYYQLDFILNEENPLIVLDYECQLFQCLSGAVDDLEYDPVNNRVINKITGTDPLVLHGNGPEENKGILHGLLVEMYKSEARPQFTYNIG